MADVDTWDGLDASVNQALEWGVALAGALASRHAVGDVVGSIGPATITRPRFGPPVLPRSGMPGRGADPDDPIDVEREQRNDVADLAAAVLAIVADPPPVMAVALTGSPTAAVELGERIQEAQRSLGLPVAPIPFAGARNDSIGGAPVEVPPVGAPPVDAMPVAPSEPIPAGAGAGDPIDPPAVDPPAVEPDPRFDPAELARTPNLRLLALALVVMVVIAVAIGIGWG